MFIIFISRFDPNFKCLLFAWDMCRIQTFIVWLFVFNMRCQVLNSTLWPNSIFMFVTIFFFLPFSFLPIHSSLIFSQSLTFSAFLSASHSASTFRFSVPASCFYFCFFFSPYLPLLSSFVLPTPYHLIQVKSLLRKLVYNLMECYRDFSTETNCSM